MMKKRLRLIKKAMLLALVGALVACQGAVAALFGEEDYSVLSRYTQVLYDYENGLPTGGINCVRQTHDGYIWAAGYSGLIRYDGEKFSVFSPKTDPGITSLSIISLFEDSRHRLWIGTNDKGAVLYENQTFHAVFPMDVAVESFAELPNGDILLGTKGGIYAIDASGNASLLSDTSTAKVMVDSAGRQWSIDSAGQLHAPPLDGLVPDASIKYSALFESTAGDIYLARQEGEHEGDILLLEKEGDGYRPVVIPTGLYRIHDFCQTRKDETWVCSDSGIGYIDGTSFSYATGAMLYSSLESITEDHEGNLWIASSRNGLLQLISQKAIDLTFAGQLGSNIVNTAVSYGGDIYIGTDNKLQILDENFRQVDNDLTRMLSVVRIRDMMVDSRDYLWIGEYEDHGLVRYAKDGEIVSINTANSGITSNKVRTILETRSGDIVAGTSSGVNIVRGTDVVARYTEAEGLTNGVVLSLAEDKRGRLYVGTDGGGIFTIEDGVLAPLAIEDLASSVILRMLYDEAEDALFISTSPAVYVYHLRDRSLTELPYANDAVSSVYDFVRDASGRIWMMGANGLITGHYDELLSGDGVTILDQTDGLPYQTTANSFSSLTDDGHLFLCGTKGLGLIDVNDFLDAESVPMLTIERAAADHESLVIGSVTSDGAHVDTARAISLPSDVMRLTLHVAVPHFSPKSNISVEYRLDNFDTRWQALGEENASEITYTNLPGGDYVFRARAVNGDGVYSDEQTIAFTKEYAPLERPIVVAALVVLGLVIVALVVYLIMRSRAQKILKRQREYKMITDQTISTIAHAIDAKDSYTEGHSRRVAAFSVEVGRRMGLGQDELEHLNYIALLHDIGKIGIPDNILNKPSRLTDEEFAIMRSHTTIGGDILKDFTAIENIGEGAASHHEKFDGTGYPNKLKGDEISLTSRIIGVCDTYDAMATARAYKAPCSTEYMVAEFKRCSGTQFDPEIAPIIIQLIEEGFSPDNPPTPGQ